MHMNQFHPTLWWKTADIDQGFYVASVQCLVLGSSVQARGLQLTISITLSVVSSEVTPPQP
jgi:hypothetical protein